MLVKNLLSSFFVFILLFSCGGGGTSSPSDEENFTFQKFLNGLVVDGYIKNAEVWIETTNDFSIVYGLQLFFRTKSAVSIT